MQDQHRYEHDEQREIERILEHWPEASRVFPMGPWFFEGFGTADPKEACGLCGQSAAVTIGHGSSDGRRTWSVERSQYCIRCASTHAARKAFLWGDRLRSVLNGEPRPSHLRWGEFLVELQSFILERAGLVDLDVFAAGLSGDDGRDDDDDGKA